MKTSKQRSQSFERFEIKIPAAQGASNGGACVIICNSSAGQQSAWRRRRRFYDAHYKTVRKFYHFMARIKIF